MIIIEIVVGALVELLLEGILRAARFVASCIIPSQLARKRARTKSSEIGRST